MVDHEALAARALDEPLTHDEREALRVWADALEWAGDPRGVLIGLEHAQREDPEHCHELRRAMLQHVMAHAREQLGDFARLAAVDRGVEIEWRSGVAYSAFVDTRYLAAAERLAPEKAVALLLAAPLAATLRRLYVRVRVYRQLDRVIAAVREAPRPGALEELVVATSVGPSPIDVDYRRVAGPADLLAVYPGLRLLVEHSFIVPLPLTLSAAASTNDVIELLAAAEPRTRVGRVMIGRSLLHRDSMIRAAAFLRLIALGPRGFAFLETLMMMLQPRTVTPQHEIPRCIAALGAAGRVALPLLGRVSGSPEYYEAETRRAADAAIAALRA